MSSSRRSSSSRSTSTLRSRKPPVWRTVTISKNSPASTGLSYVFAEPEHGSPLAPAKSNLPVIKTFSLDELDAKEDEEQTVAAMVGQRSDQVQQVTSQEDASTLANQPIAVTDGKEDGRQDIVVNQGNACVMPEETPQVAPLATEPAPNVPLINITTSTPTMSTSVLVPFPSVDTSTPSPRKSSWFGSLSRAKGRAQAEQLHRRTVISIVSTEAAPGLNAPPPTVATVNPPPMTPIDAAAMPLPPSQPPTPIPSPPRTIPHQPAPKRSWFSSPRPSTPERSNSVPSSIDDEVPTLAETPPLSSSPTSIATHAIVTTPSSDTATRRPRLSSLNPSTSRFALNIPLLGRPKVPLDQVVNDVDSKTTPTEPSPTPEQAPLPASVPEIAIVTPDPTSTPVPDPPLVTTEEANATSFSATSPIQTSSSWWSYVGWSSSTITVPSSADSAPPLSRDSSPTPTIRASTPAESSSNSNPDSTLSDACTQPLSPESNDPTTTAKPESEDAEGDIPSSSWYNPWTWYSSTSTSSLAPPPITSTSTTTDAPAPAEKPDFEAIKGDLPARAKEEEDVARVQTETLNNSEPEQPPRVLNPIEATITMNRSGWASFFSSKSLIIKTITAPPAPDVERDENGVEVMDVPDDDEPQPQSQAHTPGQRGRDATVKGSITPGDKAKSIPAKNSGELEKHKEKNKAPTPTPSTSRSSSVTPAPNLKGKAPPLIIADSIKFTPASSSARSPSPAFSIKKPPSPTPSVMSTSNSTSAAQPKSKSKSQPSSRSNTPNRPTRTSAPNLILPTWSDTFHTLPRSQVPPPPQSGSEGALSKTMRFVSGVLFAGDESARGSSDTDRDKEQEKRRRERAERFKYFGKELPRAHDVVNPPPPPVSASGSSSKWGMGKGKDKGKEREMGEKEDVLRGCKRLVVIGVHGWFPGTVMRSVIGERAWAANRIRVYPTGTSSKFVNMMVQALEEFQEANAVKLEKITKVPLEGEGTIEGRCLTSAPYRLYANLKASQEWMDDIHAADAVIVATHSQGSIVSTHLLDRLIQDGHIRTSRSVKISHPGAVAKTVLDAAESVLSTAEASPLPLPMPNTVRLDASGYPKPQRVCCLALCGIHLGPLRYLSSSSLLQPYFQYFETAAARELFEFQNTESEVSRNYVKALKRVVDHGPLLQTKMVYVASLNDQVVPIYSGLFTAASHPLILRALYIDGDAYHSSDFLSNLLVLLIRILNSGISDSGLTMHLSEATAGSLSGVGHSTVYEEISTYTLAVKYLFLTNDGLEDRHPELVLEPFNAATEQNDYEIPWSLRDVIADERVTHFFSREIAELRDAFRDWHPKTTILRELKRKLQPIQRLPPTFHSPSSSKL
ncbi:hypothetical protein C0995_009262 [Termitomyces sp. Mi166|nr:hypothetical protein C0995_009262 [Termitomyces sp. Mi166\